MQRRRILKAALALSFSGSIGVSLAQQRYAPTPSDYEGPFYPLGVRDNDSNNLLAPTFAGDDKKLQFSGELLSAQGEPIRNATIDIWHTDPEGRYKHPRDRSAGERRDDFSYWGKATTDLDGAFTFMTLVPGAYSPRPAHIHYKVWQGNKRLLTSQIYFRELGGTKGKSRHGNQSEAQLADLTAVTDKDYETFFRIVI
jgi:protocatechuate 3,4-dioxygenase beta subunit